MNGVLWCDRCCTWGGDLNELVKDEHGVSHWPTCPFAPVRRAGEEVGGSATTEVHRIEILVIDHDRLGEDEVCRVLESTCYPNHCISPSVKSIETRKVVWSDDHPLNLISSCDEAYRALFAEVAPDAAQAKRAYEAPAVESSWLGIDEEIDLFLQAAPDLWRGGDYDAKYLRDLVERSIEYGKIRAKIERAAAGVPHRDLVERAIQYGEILVRVLEG